MAVFVDTSAFIAVLDRTQEEHEPMASAWIDSLRADEHLVTSNYVLLESCSLVQARMGLPDLRRLLDDILPVVAVEWATREDHDAGVAGVLAAGRRRLSIVDCVSFTVMRRLGIREYLGLDPHFAEQGFRGYSSRP